MDIDWSDCPLIERVPGKHSGDPVFNGTRLPVDTITGNVDSFMEDEGMSEDQAIEATLECFPSTPGGADAIRTVLAYRAAHEHLLQP